MADKHYATGGISQIRWYTTRLANHFCIPSALKDILDHIPKESGYKQKFVVLLFRLLRQLESVMSRKTCWKQLVLCRGMDRLCSLALF
jgi:hypothetical protein